MIRARSSSTGTGAALFIGILGSCACATAGSASLTANGLAEIRIEVGRVRAQQEQLHGALTALAAAARAVESPAPPDRGVSVPAVPPAEAEPFYRQGYALFHRGDYAGAEQALRAYLEARPDSPHADQAFFWLGESLFAADRQGEAVQVFETLLSRFPSSERAPRARDRVAAARAPRR
jgi:TolA-binding protein